jgi:hypothetical protein
MAWNALVNPLTRQLYPDLIPGSGGVQLQKGELISANAAGEEVAVPTGANGTFLQATNDPNNVDGLQWVAIPGAFPLQFGQLISAVANGDATAVPAPANPAQDGWVLTADHNAPTGLVWADAGQTTYTAEGQIQYAGAGPGFTDTNLDIGTAGQVLAVNPGGTAPAWVNVGGSGTITATLPLVESAVGSASNIAISFAAKGDLPCGTGALTGGLIGVGADGAVLTSDSTATGNPYGMRWSVPTGSGAVQRIITPGTTTIPAPTQSNQQLQLIDTASTTNTFIFESGAPHPSPTFTISGTFSNQIGGVFQMVVYGNDPSTPGGGNGQVWYYEPNILTPANGIWKLIAQSQNGGTIVCGCLRNPDPTVVAGYSACDMVFGGTFTGGEYVPTGTAFFGATNFFYLSNAGAITVPNFTNYSINPLPSGIAICGVATNANSGSIAFIAFSTNKNGSFKVNVGANPVEYNGIALITTAADIVPLQGGTTGLPTPPTSGVFPSSTNVQFINSLSWTFGGNLSIVGGFASVVILGTAIPNSSDVVFLTYDPTPNSIAGFIAPAPPNIGGTFNGTISTLRATYDPTIGSLIAGDYSQGPSTNITFLSPAGAVQQLEVSSESDYTNAIGIDAGAYVGVLGFGNQLYGYANGFAQTFGVQISLDWYIPKIAQGFPLSFIGTNNKTMYQGYFKTTGNTTTIHFTPAKVRYSLPSGSSGLASFAVLNSFYSSLTLIGDTTAPAPGVWDLVGYTGNISFS